MAYGALLGCPVGLRRAILGPSRPVRAHGGRGLRPWPRQPGQAKGPCRSDRSVSTSIPASLARL
eukprot:4626213-Pyramimonas_sp.AAC.1